MDLFEGPTKALKLTTYLEDNVTGHSDVADGESLKGPKGDLAARHLD